MWQTFRFGGNAGSCVFNDVAIINDTLAYAVGAIYLNDSTTGQPDPNAYNLVKWDGVKWNLLRLQFYTFCGQSSTGSYPTNAILAFGPTDIWIASGSEITHYDGANQLVTICTPVSTNKLWGTSSNDIYAVGALGGIAHYNGSVWTKIESGTTISINDIYGAYNSASKQWEILAVASQNLPTGHAILSINGNTATPLSSNPIDNVEEYFGVWFVPCEQYYVIGDGIYQKNLLSDAAWRNNPLDVTHYATTKIRGNAINDVFACGAFGEVLHFNGSTWKSYQSTTYLSDGAYTSIAIQNNFVIVVGGDNPLAAVAIGRR
jgi:hypothetical protein